MTLGGGPFGRKAAAFHDPFDRCACTRSSVHSRRSLARVPSSRGCARSRAWACSPPRRSSPSWATCSASPPVVTSPATSASRPGSRRAACGGGSARSANAAIRTFGCCLSTGRGLCCGTPEEDGERARPTAHLGARSRARTAPQQGRCRPREQARARGLGRVASRAALRRAPRERNGMIHPPRDCFEYTTVTAHRFRPARGTPIAALAHRGRVSDWLPARGFSSWPGARALHEKRGRRYDCSRTLRATTVGRENQLAGGVQIHAARPYGATGSVCECRAQTEGPLKPW